MKKLVLAGQNVIEARGATAALHSRELKRSTYSHLWNYSSLQIKAKRDVITQTAQASAWPLSNIWQSEEREAEDIQTWGRSPERESEIIYQSSRCGLEAKERSPTIWFFMCSGKLDFISLKKYANLDGRCSHCIQFFLFSRKISLFFSQLLESKGWTMCMIQGNLSACLSFLLLLILTRHPKTLNTESAEIWISKVPLGILWRNCRGPQ